MGNENNKRIVFLCSGGGGNLRFVKIAADKGWLRQVTITGVLTDRECGASDYARLHEIDQKPVNFTDKEQLDLINSLEYYNPDIVITNIHRILNEKVIEKFRGKLINLHYSLLPAFGGSIGTAPIKAALAFGAKIIGVTVHLVDESLDGGRPLIQVAIPVKKFDDVTILMDLLFRCGCLSLVAAINYYLYDNKLSNSDEEVLKIKDRYCFFSNRINLPFNIENETFWKSIRQ